MTGLDTKIRLRAEGAAVAGKSIVTFLVMFLDPHRDDPKKQWALLAFAVGQVFFSICVLGVYLRHFCLSYLKPSFTREVKEYVTFFDL